MRITDVRMRKLDDTGAMKAVCSITIDDCFVVHDLRVVEGLNGLFVAMPSRKTADGEYRDVAHPIVNETRLQISEAVLAKYHE